MPTRLFFILFVACFSFAEAQNCDLHPNKPEILREYGVKKIKTYVQPYAGQKEIYSVYFLDSTGCAWRWLTRRFNANTYTYYVNEEKGSWMSGKKERYSAWLDKDSNEVLIERAIDYYAEGGRIYKQETWRPEDGKIFKTTTFSAAGEPDLIDRKIYVTNEEGDTVRKIFNKSDARESSYLYLKFENGQWTEHQKWITKRDTAGRMTEYKSWEKEKLVEGKKYIINKLGNGGSEVIETDLNNNPVNKTVYNERGDYSFYEFKDEKWVFKYAEQMPVADPVDDFYPFVNIIEEDPNVSDKKTTEIKKRVKEKSSASKKKEFKKLSKKPHVVKMSYRDPVKKDQVVIKEIFTAEGLILETDVVRDEKKFIYEYEFF